jgi:hypothetical protein
LSTIRPTALLGRAAAGILCLLAAFLGVLAPATSAHAAPDNPNPIDWRVYRSYLGAAMNDVPLRYGQADFVADNGEVIDGFGKLHIEQHGPVPPDFDIQETIGNAENCVPGPDARVRCFNDETLLFVVYSPVVDPRSGDGRPFGIITAFYQLPGCEEAAAAGRGAASDSVSVQQECGGTERVPTSLRYTGPTRILGDTARLSAVLTDDLGIPLAGKTVHFALGSASCADATDGSGSAQCSISPVPSGQGLTVQVSFAGDDGFLPSSITVPLIRDLPPTVDAGPDVTGDEAAPVTLRGSATDDHGTPSTHWSYTTGPDVDAGASCSFADASTPTTSFTCDDDGTFTVTLRADDGFNAPVRDSATVRLANVPPKLTLAGPAAWQLFTVGQPVQVSAPITDAANDTHTCRIDWDDNSADTAPATQRSCAGSHAFTHAGMYTLQVTATDDDGGSGSATVLVVVYDPAAGGVTLNGATETPAGALVIDPSTDSPTRAHLAAHYQPGHQTPVGTAKAWITQTAFRMSAAAQLQWLVVTPDGKIASKGTNVRPDGRQYGFVFYGYTSPDRMRVVVWDLSAGENPGQGTILDTRAGQSYDLDLADPLPLTSGAIRIHH